MKQSLLYRITGAVKEYPLGVLQKHIILFVLTYASMIVTYGGFVYGTMAVRAAQGAIYATSLMIILLSHEFGHFLQAKKYGVDCSLPYFIPVPFFSPFGTMGAFIRIRSTPPSLQALFDISYWGPAMSFFLSVPALILGMALSEVTPSVHEHAFVLGDTGLIFGPSMLTHFLQTTVFDVPAGHSLAMHPLAYAGWVGLFVTAINLFPVGQLDGGHIAYSFLGKTQTYLAYVFLVVLLILSTEFSSAWIFWALFLLFLGIKHPIMKIAKPEKTPMDAKRKLLGLFSALMFVVSFIPAPITFARAKKKPPEQHSPQENIFKYEINYKPSVEQPLWK